MENIHFFQLIVLVQQQATLPLWKTVYGKMLLNVLWQNELLNAQLML